jgi:hypothetical protein
MLSQLSEKDLRSYKQSQNVSNNADLGKPESQPVNSFSKNLQNFSP